MRGIPARRAKYQRVMQGWCFKQHAPSHFTPAPLALAIIPTTHPNMEKHVTIDLDKLASLCKRRGFIFQSSEIYGGLASTWDYGPLGAELKRNVKDSWWRSMVLERDDMVGLDSAIIMHPEVWKASGHVESFTDPLVECVVCHRRWREDQLPPVVPAEGDLTPSPSTGEDPFAPVSVDAEGEALSAPVVPAEAGTHSPAPDPVCPECEGKLTPPRMFNLMFETHMGPVRSDENTVHLRPETAQGIFVNFANVVTATRRRPPFGIAQIGKAFRNEITTGNFIYRTREFEMMEIEFFVPPGEDERVARALDRRVGPLVREPRCRRVEASHPPARP